MIFVFIQKFDNFFKILVKIALIFGFLLLYDTQALKVIYQVFCLHENIGAVFANFWVMRF